ncbi:MAG: hypothetical protein ACTSUD_11665 [Alphaproteobacteria bacterium]
MSIFSMSALDIFASAMGTFILIAVVLFPFYLRQDSPVRAIMKQVGRIEAIKKRIKSAAGQARAARAAAGKARAETARAKKATAEAKGPMRLPKGGKDPTSLKFALGCWRTDPFRHGPRYKPGVSQYCFDKTGKGNMLYSRQGERMVCAAFARIRRQGSVIRIDDRNSRCNIDQKDKGPWRADHLVCRPDAGGILYCEGRTVAGSRWRVRLNRL